MSITDWPAEDRPREKLLAKGAESLTHAELLAIFLRVGTKGKSAVELARELLDQFGSLDALLSASREQFCSANGLGDAKYSQLQASLEMSRRFLYERIEKQGVLDSPNATRQYLQSKLRSRPAEVFSGLFLDNQHRVISYQELFFGTINSASVHPREVVRKAIETNAAAMIFAHNHPSGIAEPSRADIDITKQLKASLALIDVRVLDHILVAGHETISFAERGLI